MIKHIVIPTTLAVLLLSTKKYKTFSSTICYYAQKGLDHIVNIKFQEVNFKTITIKRNKTYLKIDSDIKTPRTHFIVINTNTFNRINSFAINEKISFSKAISYLSYLGLIEDYNIDFAFMIDR